MQRGTITSQQVRLVNTDPVLAAPYITKGLGFRRAGTGARPAGSRRALPARRAALLALAPRPRGRSGRGRQAARVGAGRPRARGQDQSLGSAGVGVARATCTTTPRAPPMRSWRRGAPTRKTPTSPTSTRSSTASSIPRTTWPSLPTPSSGATRASAASRPTTASSCAASGCWPAAPRRRTSPRAWRLRDSVGRAGPGAGPGVPDTDGADDRRRRDRAGQAGRQRPAVSRSDRAGTPKSTRPTTSPRRRPTSTPCSATRKAAFKALKTYWTANPSQQKAMAESAGWRFESLQSDPEWSQGGRLPLTAGVGRITIHVLPRYGTVTIRLTSAIG